MQVMPPRGRCKMRGIGVFEDRSTLARSPRGKAELTAHLEIDPISLALLVAGLMRYA